MKQEEKLRMVGNKVNLLSAISVSMLVFCVLLVVCLLLADIFYLAEKGLSRQELLSLFTSKDILRALWVSLTTSIATLFFVTMTALPAGYALSRYRFPGRAIINTLVDVPIFLPPVVIGVSLLAFFGSGLGLEIREFLEGMGISLVSWFGIVMCQYVISMSYGIRSVKAAFDANTHDLEEMACTLGCSRWQAFWKVSIPLAWPGIVAGCILVWARGLGVFGPVMVFIGTGPRVQVLPTMIWLELSVGSIEVSLAIAIMMLAMVGAALTLVHLLVGDRRLL
jgi:molybdate transport system permease protein